MSDRRLVALLLLVVLVAGCANPYTIVRDLDAPVSEHATFSVVQITDNLPTTIDPGERPTQQQIDELRLEIASALEELDDFDWNRIGADDAADYEIRGRLVDFAPGSGWVRFLIGFGAGTARITVVLELYSTWDDRVLFAGRYEAAVSSWAESGDVMYSRVAHAFADHIADRQEELTSGPSR